MTAEHIGRHIADVLGGVATRTISIVPLITLQR
jgi:hypothetical protein